MRLAPVASTTEALLAPICFPSTPSSTGHSAPLPFAPDGMRNDWGRFFLPNKFMCPLVAVFEAATWPPTTLWDSPPSRTIILIWLGYIPSGLAIIHLTAHRHGKNWLPPVMGVYQWFSSALCAPFVGAFIVPRLFPAREKAGRPYTRASVEGLIVGLVLGYFVPSYFLLFSTGDKRQGWVAGWQFLPVWLWVGQEGWKRVRRTIDASGERRAGKAELQALGALCGLSSLAGHAVMLHDLWTHGSLTHLLPPVHASTSKDLTYLCGAILGYDLIITHLAVVMIVVYLSSSIGGGRGGTVLASATRVTIGTLLGGPGLGMGAEWWKYGGGAQ